MTGSTTTTPALDRLATARPFPTGADLAAAAADPDTLVAAVMGVLDEAVRTGETLPEEERLLIFGLAALSTVPSRPRLFGNLLVALRLNPYVFARIYGDVADRAIPALLAAFYVETEHDLLLTTLNRSAPFYVLVPALRVAQRVAFDGRLDRTALDDRLLQTMNWSYDDTDEAVWDAMEDAITALGLPRSMARLRIALKTVVADGDATMGQLETRHAAALRNPADPAAMEADGLMALDHPDTRDALLGAYARPEAVESIGRSPLDVPVADLNWLAGQLLRVAPETGMRLGELMGFFHGLAVAPLTVPEDEWFPVLMVGVDDVPLPQVATRPEVEARMRAIASAFLAAVTDEVDAGVETMDAADFEGSTGEEWATGFSMALAIDPDRWAEWLTDIGAADLLGLVAMLATPPGQRRSGGLDDIDRAMVVANMPVVLTALRRTRMTDVPFDPKVIPRPESAIPKVGRNDPCPCGSGLKYKKCHGR